MQTNRLLPQFKQWASLYLSEQMGQVSLHRNFKLLLTQIFCRRLNLEQGTVSLEVGLSYDLLRFIPCSTICFSSFQALQHWGINLLTTFTLLTNVKNTLPFNTIFIKMTILYIHVYTLSCILYLVLCTKYVAQTLYMSTVCM